MAAAARVVAAATAARRRSRRLFLWTAAECEAISFLFSFLQEVEARRLLLLALSALPSQ